MTRYLRGKRVEHGKMTFWRMHHPDYDSDYHDTYINGSLVHPFALPGVNCDVCGQTWSSGRVLPYECPQEFRMNRKLTEPWPVPRSEHMSLQRDLMRALGLEGQPFDTLRPGDSFQPCSFDVPSLPRADFLWASLYGPVVSRKIRDLLLDCCHTDIAACPVNLRRVGQLDPSLPPPDPSTGEPEDLIEEAPLLNDHSGVGPYFEMVVLGESGLPEGCELVSVCPACKRPEVNTKNRLLRMTERAWNGQHVFLLATTLYVVVTDSLKKRIEDCRATNVTFASLSWTEWTAAR